MARPVSGSVTILFQIEPACSTSRRVCAADSALQPGICPTRPWAAVIRDPSPVMNNTPVPSG